MWYTLYLTADGTRLAPPTQTLEPGLPNATVGVLTTPTRPDEATVMWDPAQRLYVPRPPGARRVGSRLEFRRRFTTAERRYLKRLTIDPAASLDVRAIVLDAEDLVRDATAIEIDDQDAQGLTAGIVDLLVAGGVVPLAHRDARIAEILAPWPAPGT